MEIFANSRFLEVVVHDLRTPLNVINLTFRMLDSAALARAPELAEDLEMISSNVSELERMLMYLVDVSRLPPSVDGLAPESFNPMHLIEDAAAEHRRKSGGEVAIVDDGAPREVRLDLKHARMAVQKALENASTASASKPVRIRLAGTPDRLTIRFEVAVPPRSSVRSHAIEPEQFQRIVGTAGERRGLDLAIAAEISALFGGEARLEAIEGEGTALVLEWPTTPALPVDATPAPALH